MNALDLFITCPRGLEGLLLEELKALSASSCKETIGGVHCQVQLETMYHICLWSRFANRVYLLLAHGPVSSTKEAYDLCTNVPWENLLKLNATIAVDFTGMSEFIRNTMFGAQLIKDAIVDRLQKIKGQRPTVEPKNPDCLIHARLIHGELALFYDLGGHSLHQRGYRKETGEAPLKENLAAAIVVRSGWTKDMTLPLVDPFCGSGTILIEAAMIASDKAPGLDRLDYGFANWLGHDEALWATTQRTALERHEAALDKMQSRFFGYDQDAKVIRAATKNIRAAGFSDIIEVEERDIRDFHAPGQAAMLVTNPPYGERLGVSQTLMHLYKHLGRVIQEGRGGKAAVMTSDPELARATRLRSHKQYSFMNGKIPCKLYLFDAPR